MSTAAELPPSPAPEPSPVAAAPAPSGWDRLAPRILAVVAALLVAWYGSKVLKLHFEPAFKLYGYEGDWKQWVWPYWRSHIDGAFPEGNVITDYAFAVQPPLWRAMMSASATLFEPGTGAVFFNLVAYLGAVVALGWAVKVRTNLVMGIASMALLLRDADWHRVTAGGYPRSFGPTLVIVFAAAWLAGRHRMVLVVLLIQAALYPSVVVPCGLAYGLWTLGLWLVEKTPRKLLETVVAGVFVVLLAKSQDWLAPAWWGPVVTIEDAKQMGGVLNSGGRVRWLPLYPYWSTVKSFLMQPFIVNGDAVGGIKFLWGISSRNRELLFLGIAALCTVAAALRRRAPPWPLFLLIGSSLLTYELARVLAFKLYLPERVPQHTLAYVVAALFPILVFEGCKAVLPRFAVAHTLLAVALSVGLVFASAGDGLRSRGGFWAPHGYKGFIAPYQWMRDHTPLTATFAGNLGAMERVPLFGIRQVYVNWAMAHPFRMGFWKEIERRIKKSYQILYAPSLAEVVRLCREEKIDFLFYDENVLKTFERRGKAALFEPVRTPVWNEYFKPNEGRFGLLQLPASAAVYRGRGHVIVDITKLEASLSAPAQPATPLPSVGADAGPAEDVDEDDDGPGTESGAPEP